MPPGPPVDLQGCPARDYVISVDILLLCNINQSIPCSNVDVGGFLSTYLRIPRYLRSTKVCTEYCVSNCPDGGGQVSATPVDDLVGLNICNRSFQSSIYTYIPTRDVLRNGSTAGWTVARPLVCARHAHCRTVQVCNCATGSPTRCICRPRCKPTPAAPSGQLSALPAPAPFPDFYSTSPSGDHLQPYLWPR